MDIRKLLRRAAAEAAGEVTFGSRHADEGRLERALREAKRMGIAAGDDDYDHAVAMLAELRQARGE